MNRQIPKSQQYDDPEALAPSDTFLNGWLPLPSTGVPKHPPGKLEMRSADGYMESFKATSNDFYKGCKSFGVDCHKATAYRFTPQAIDDGLLHDRPYNAEPVRAAKATKVRDISREAGWFWVYNGQCNEKHLFMGMPLECKFEDGRFKILPYGGGFFADIVAARRIKPKAKPARIPPRIILDEPLEDCIAAEKNADAKRAFNGDGNMSGRTLMAQHFTKPKFDSLDPNTWPEIYAKPPGTNIETVNAYDRFRNSPRGKEALAMIGKHEGPAFAPLGEDTINDIAAAALEAHDRIWPRRKK